MILLPSPGFRTRELKLFRASGTWRRCYRTIYSDPLGFGYGPSRFSDPQKPPRFGAVYLGSSVHVCFVETILRDRGDGRLGNFLISWNELQEWYCAELRIHSHLDLVDLRGNGLLVMGIPTDVVGAGSQDMARDLSVPLWDHQ